MEGFDSGFASSVVLCKFNTLCESMTQIALGSVNNALSQEI